MSFRPIREGQLKKPWTIAETPYPRRTFRLPKVLSVEQVSKLIDAAPTLFYRILLMALYATGLRRAELAHLKLGDVDSDLLLTTTVANLTNLRILDRDLGDGKRANHLATKG